MPTGPDLPSTAMLMRIAADHGLDLTTADADSYRSLMAGAIESYRRLEAFSEPKPPLKCPRDGGWRPRPEDNPFNGWYWRCNIAGAASGVHRQENPAGRHTRRRQSIPGLVRLEPDGRRGPHRARHPGCARPGAAMGNHGAPACGRAITVAPARVTAALVILGGCFWALSQVLTRIPMGLAYAIWFEAGIALICVARLRAGTSERSGARTQAAPYHSRLLKWCGCFSTDVNDI